MTDQRQREHGTGYGVWLHRKHGEPRCADCRAFEARLRKEQRAAGDRTTHRRYMAARGRALTKVANDHRDEFEALLREELGRDFVRRPRRNAGAR